MSKSAATAAPRMSLRRKLSKYRFYYLLALPGLIYLLIFKYAPMFGLVIAFKDYDPYSGVAGIFSAPWVGLANFRKFFDSYYFGRIMSNTLIISFLKLIFGFPAPIIFALMINEARGKYFKKTVQTISYIPHFISWVIVAALLQTLLTTDNGLINVILNRFGMRSVNFLSNPKYYRSILIISDIWKSVGFGSIVYLAAITGVDQSQYEAAAIDGAGRFKRIWYITLPSISSVVVIMLIFRVGGLLGRGLRADLPDVFSLGVQGGGHHRHLCVPGRPCGSRLFLLRRGELLQVRGGGAAALDHERYLQAHLRRKVSGKEAKK